MESPQPPPQPKRLPSLKITASGQIVTSTNSSSASGLSNGTSSAPPQSAPSQTPQSTAGSGFPKIKLVAKSSTVQPSQPSTPADSRPSDAMLSAAASSPSSGPPKIVTQAGRVSIPTAKKRAREENDDSDEDLPLAAKNHHHNYQSNASKNDSPHIKKTKITIKPPTTPGGGGIVRQPTLKVKPVGRIPTRPPGEGYDSEAEDREVDPVIEEQFLLRLLPGEHCEYVRKCIQERKIGLPKHQGGADIQLRWLDDEGRRACLTILGQHFAGVLLDLPTITEGMKTWDKKNMVKSSDICQMLLVFAKVNSEEEAKSIELPSPVEPGYRWPHGITPPMHDARNRRFRKRLSKLEIKNKEAEVERLLNADRDAVNVKTEWIDAKREVAEVEEDEEEYDEDAEGEMDEFFGGGSQVPATQMQRRQQQDEEEEEEEGEGEGEGEEEAESEVDDAALEAEFLDAQETPIEGAGVTVSASTIVAASAPSAGAAGAAAVDGVTPVTANGTPGAEEEAAGEEELDEGEEGGDEEEEEEEEEDDEEDEEDEDEGGEGGADDEDDEDHDKKASVRNEIAQLKRQLKQYEEQLASVTGPIMKKRLEGNIKNIMSEIQLKKSILGEADED